MVGLTELSVGVPLPPGLGFTVSHQKVELDVDFVSKRVTGRTEITIHPFSRELKTIRLNCRQCRLKRLNVEGRGCSIKYLEPYARFKIHPEATVHQFHQLRQKLLPQLKEPPEEELIVTLPKTLRIEELDPFSSEAQAIPLIRSSASFRKDGPDTGTTPSTPWPRTADDSGARFTPLTVIIEFVVDTFRDGLHFVGCEEDDLRYPHVYTRNSSFPGSACCVFPCVDDLSTRCTWEIAIRCPRTLADATGEPRNSPAGTVSNEVNGIQGQNGTARPEHGPGRTETGLTEEDRSLDISVVCTGDLTDEIVDPLDSTKKTAYFFCSTPVLANHVGFAAGVFEYVSLSKFREVEEDDKLGQNAIPVHGFCLPGRAEEVKNTCLPLTMAIDSFTQTYGSYPFTSFKLCFVDDLVLDTAPTASMAICSNRLLFPADIIDPMPRVTRELIHAIASQWIGINIIPRESTDNWAVIGIAFFITDTFLRNLMGKNEYGFRQKTMADRVCELDVQKPSLHSAGALLSVDKSLLELIALKAPLVLYILDRRLTKANGSASLLRVISRVFLNAKMGDLANGALTTTHFLRTCEKLGHAKLEAFFEQWVYGAGCPHFVVSQRFNKKKLVVEMSIKQVQSEEQVARDLTPERFMTEVKEDLYNVESPEVQRAFTGPMTIRIHEADGTPYEHIVDIKDQHTRIDVPYNTKYKRLKRSRRQKERAAAAAGIDVSADTQDDVLLYCLGDVLQSEEEVRDWRLTDWGKDDEEKMSQESYEWIRMDAEFEWICQMSLIMPGYMYLSQLQQDRDVVAQYQSIQYITAQRETPLMSTILLRTLMDRRYFHGIRTAAAQALAKCAREELDWVGSYHLEKAFQEYFCFPDSIMTRTNDFSDRTAYYIQCAIPEAMAKVKNRHGRAPPHVQKFLLDKLRFNDNTNNEYSDCHYVATLMSALAQSLVTVSSVQDSFSFDMDEDDEDERLRLAREAVDEIDRYRRMDEWVGSYQNVYSVTALQCKEVLTKAKALPADAIDFLQYTREGGLDILRLQAFDSLVSLGALKHDAILKYFLFTLSKDPSPFVRDRMHRIFGRGLALFAIGESKPAPTRPPQGDLVIEQGDHDMGILQDNRNRLTSVEGALSALKNEVGEREGLKQALWKAVTSPIIGLHEMRELLDICKVMYDPITSYLVKLRYPRFWGVENLGDGQVRFHRVAKARTKMMPAKLERPAVAPAAAGAGAVAGAGVPAATASAVQGGAPPGASGNAVKPAPLKLKITSRAPPRPPTTEPVKPKLTIKFKLPGS